MDRAVMDNDGIDIGNVVDLSEGQSDLHQRSRRETSTGFSNEGWGSPEQITIPGNSQLGRTTAVSR